MTGGWVEASRAHFSKGWNVPGADDLSELVAGAPYPSSELAQIADRLIAEPSGGVGGANPNVAKWASFLKVLGVTATLPINQAADARRMYGQTLTAGNIARDGAVPRGIPTGAIEQWGRRNHLNGQHPPSVDLLLDEGPGLLVRRPARSGGTLRPACGAHTRDWSSSPHRLSRMRTGDPPGVVTDPEAGPRLSKRPSESFLVHSPTGCL